MLAAALGATDSASAGVWKTDPAIKAEPLKGTNGWGLTFTQYQLACNGSPSPPVEVAVAAVSADGSVEAGEVIKPHGDCGFWSAGGVRRLPLPEGLTAGPPADEEARALQQWHEHTSSEASLAETLTKEAAVNRSTAKALPGTELAQRSEAEAAEEEAQAAKALAASRSPLHGTLALTLEPGLPGYTFYAVLTEGKVIEEGGFTFRDTRTARRIYEGSDEFVNYCIDEGKRIESENKRLYCLGEPEGAEWVEAGWPARVRTAFLAHRHKGTPKGRGKKRGSKRRSKHRRRGA